MNQISFTCSNNHPFKVPAKFAGKRAKCPKCGEVVTIPQVSTLNTTSKIIPSNDDLEKSRSTGELSPLAASIANSYTQNPVTDTETHCAQSSNEQPSTDVPGWVFWAIVPVGWALFNYPILRGLLFIFVCLFLLLGLINFLGSNPKARWPVFACVSFLIFCFAALSIYDRVETYGELTELHRRKDAAAKHFENVTRSLEPQTIELRLKR